MTTSNIHNLFDTFNNTLLEAQQMFVDRFRVRASIELKLDSGEPAGELVYLKKGDAYQLFVKRQDGPELHPFQSQSLETRSLVAAALEPMWQACEAADDEVSQKILHAICDVRLWIDTKRKVAP